MGQLPYFPPTVAGWEGGASWLNTNTALARFSAANRCCRCKYANARDQGARGRARRDAAKQAFDARPRVPSGAPGSGAGTKSSLLDYATKARNTSSNDRIARQRVLRAFLLGGPDAQVM